jgi:hypothetical protein
MQELHIPSATGTPVERAAMAKLRIESINAVTLAVHDMAGSVRFYTAPGFRLRYGGEHAPFTSLHAGSGYLNLIAQPPDRCRAWWGRVILHVSDADAFHRRALERGLAPTTTPAVAPWGASASFASAIRTAMN